MVLHTRDIIALNDLHRQELIDHATQERLAAFACERPRRAGRRPRQLPRFAEVVPMLLAAVRPHPRPRFGSHA